MSIAGIDFSSRAVDIVLLDEDTDAATWHRFELTGQDAFDRARSVRTALQSHIRPHWTWDDIVACGIEQPRGNHGVVHMARIQGAVLACIPHYKLVLPLNPSEWRKTVGLPGNASKDAIKSQVITWAWASGSGEWPQDACDAYCIALATRTLLERTEAA